MSSSVEKPRGRLRFADLEFEPRPDGKGRVLVRMEWRGREIQGDAEGILTREAELLMGAHASLAIVNQVAADVVEADLVGVKAVRAFDAWVVIASIRARTRERDYRLLGAKACDREDELPRGAAIAVLDALNRVLEKVLT
jgi:hypothetical protein